MKKNKIAQLLTKYSTSHWFCRVTLMMFLTAFSSSALFAQNYTYNQNVQVKSELENGKKYQNKDGEFYILEMKEIPEKDLAGNAGYQLIYKGKKDTLIFAPENTIFPLTYVQITKHGDGKHYYIKDQGQYDGQYVIFKKNLIQVKAKSTPPFEKASLAVTTSGVPNNFIIYSVASLSTNAVPPYGMYIKSKDADKLGKEFNETVGNKLNQTGGAFGGGSVHSQNYPGLTEFYKFRNQFMDKLLKDSEKGYKALLNETLKEGEQYVYHMESSYTVTKDAPDSKIKIKLEKTGNDISKIVFQFPFTDGLFYDKEKFFYTSTLQSDSKRFNYKGENQLTLIPFAGRILIVGVYHEYTSIFGIISPIDNDAFALNLGKQMLTSILQSETMWCKQELEESYDSKKDKYSWQNFFSSYVAKIMAVK